MRRIAVLVCTLFAAGSLGCFGFVGVVRGAEQYTVEHPRLFTPTGARPATADNLREALGEPRRVDQDGDREVWHYREGLRWHGVVLLVIVVPIPLVIPTGVNEAQVTFEDGVAVALSGRRNATLARAGCLFGSPFPSGDGPCEVTGRSPPDLTLRRNGASLGALALPTPAAKGVP